MGLPPAECTVHPAWNVASPAAIAPWVARGRPLTRSCSAKVVCDSSEIPGPRSERSRWLPDANVMLPTSAGTSTIGIHIVMVGTSSNGQ